MVSRDMVLRDGSRTSVCLVDGARGFVTVYVVVLRVGLEVDSVGFASISWWNWCF